MSTFEIIYVIGHTIGSFLLLMIPFFVVKDCIIIIARKTTANPDAYCLDLRVRLSVGCKRRSYFFFLYLPVFSYLRL